jgi:hypothetical protein
MGDAHDDSFESAGLGFHLTAVASAADARYLAGHVGATTKVVTHDISKHLSAHASAITTVTTQDISKPLTAGVGAHLTGIMHDVSNALAAGMGFHTTGLATDYTTLSEGMGFALKVVTHDVTKALKIGLAARTRGPTTGTSSIVVTLKYKGKLLDFNGLKEDFTWPPIVTEIIGSDSNDNDIMIMYDFSNGAANWVEETSEGTANITEGGSSGLGTLTNGIVPAEVHWTRRIRTMKWNGVIYTTVYPPGIP